MRVKCIATPNEIFAPQRNFPSTQRRFGAELATIRAMKLLLLALALCACGSSPDTRPVTFEVVVTEVLGPSCGQVQCHSSTTNEKRYRFDTIADARASM